MTILAIVGTSYIVACVLGCLLAGLLELGHARQPRNLTGEGL